MATINRQQTETVLIRRAGAIMAEAGMDGASRSGQNEDLNNPIVTALLKMGHTTIDDVSDVSDADISAVTETELAQFLDLAEYRLLFDTGNRLTQVDTTIGPRRERLGQLKRELRRTLELLTKRLKDEYGFGSSELEIGSLGLAFQTHGDDTII